MALGPGSSSVGARRHHVTSRHSRGFCREVVACKVPAHRVGNALVSARCTRHCVRAAGGPSGLNLTGAVTTTAAEAASSAEVAGSVVSNANSVANGDLSTSLCAPGGVRCASRPCAACRGECEVCRDEPLVVALPPAVICKIGVTAFPGLARVPLTRDSFGDSSTNGFIPHSPTGEPRRTVFSNTSTDGNVAAGSSSGAIPVTGTNAHCGGSNGGVSASHPAAATMPTTQGATSSGVSATAAARGAATCQGAGTTTGHLVSKR